MCLLIFYHLIGVGTVSVVVLVLECILLICDHLKVSEQCRGVV